MLYLRLLVVSLHFRFDLFGFVLLLMILERMVTSKFVKQLIFVELANLVIFEVEVKMSQKTSVVDLKVFVEEANFAIFEVEVKKEVGNKVVAKHSILFVEVNLDLKKN